MIEPSASRSVRHRATASVDLRASGNNSGTITNSSSSGVIFWVVVALLCLDQFLINFKQQPPLTLEMLEKSKSSFVTTSQTQHGNWTRRRRKRRRPQQPSVKQDDTSTYANATQQSPNYHVIFSSSCTAQQHWESLVFFYHAAQVRQPGTVTRIASGCTRPEAQELRTFHARYIQPLNANFHVHFTPDYSRVQLDQHHWPYKYMNKPYGVLHWMDHALGMNYSNSATTKATASSSSQHHDYASTDDDIVILMDPDMLLLRPITHNFTDPRHTFVDEDKGLVPRTRVVRHGFPIAQQDGYLNSEWIDLNMTYVVQPDDDQARPPLLPLPSWQDGHRYWNAGPPYLATVRDMYALAQRWTQYAPRVLRSHGHLFDEMYGYIIAAWQLQLPHTLVSSMMVSTTETNDREGWSLVDALPDDQLCAPAPSDAALPIGLHYCKRYFLGKSFFSKYRLKKNIMDCDKALLQPVPTNLHTQVDYAITPPRADRRDVDTYMQQRPHKMTVRQARREQFMLCGITRAVNEALRDYKRRKCDKVFANLNETYTVYNDPSDY